MFFGEIMKKTGVEIETLRSLFEQEHETDYSRKIALLKGASRVRFRNEGHTIIASSQLSSFESNLCNKLLMLGADVAFVGSVQGDGLRISGRARHALTEKGLHLGTLLESIGKEVGGAGGGHAGAAGLTTEAGDVEAVLRMICQKVHAYGDIQIGRSS